jgi:hypothetical protein
MLKHNNIRSLNSLFFLVAMSLLACKKEYDPVFKESPDKRVQQALDGYDSLLISAPFGWKATLYTGKGAGYFYYFDFKEDGSVTMLSDFNASTAEKTMAGTWVLKALQRPTLSFDTYSYVHLPADPDGSVNGGANGEGLVSDFEFAFAKTSQDSVVLEGIQHNTEMTLVKATEQESGALLNKRLGKIFQSTQQYLSANRGLLLVLPDGTTVTLAFDVNQKMFGAQYMVADGSSIQLFKSAFNFSTEGIWLKSPLRIGTYTIQAFFWDDEKGLYFVKIGENPKEIINSTEPFIFKLRQPLHLVLGYSYSAIQIPEGSGTHPLNGQSEAFLSVYNAAADSMLAGQYKLTMREMNLVFKPADNIALLDVTISQTVNGVTTRYLAEYAYSYTKSEEGVFKFTFTGGNQNAGAIASAMQGLLNYLENDTFKMEYIGGDFNLTGGVFSQENPAFYFSGYLVQ